MPTYAAFLGNHPHLSLAELACTFADFSLLERYADHAVLFSSSSAMTQKDVDRMGGVFLLCTELKKGAHLRDVPALLAQETVKVKGKITFSIRAYGVPRDAVKKLYRECKTHLVGLKRAVRYIGNEMKPPVSGQLHDADLLSGKGGRELVLLQSEKGVWLGLTVAAQNPRAYTVRDMEKPVRDTRIGLLPPKVAQIMLNFGAYAAAQQRGPKAKKPTSLTVFDPFCGTGVIPIEALLRGDAVLASDVSLKAVNGTEKNIDWLRKTYKVFKKDTDSTVWKQDACKPFDLKTLPDVVVTESMLGPNVSVRPSQKDALAMRRECEDLESAFLKNTAVTLKGVPLVLCFPVWFLRSETLHLVKVWDTIAALGYRAILPPDIRSSHPSHASLLYHHPDQFVGREVVMLLPPAL